MIWKSADTFSKNLYEWEDVIKDLRLILGGFDTSKKWWDLRSTERLGTNWQKCHTLVHPLCREYDLILFKTKPNLAAFLCVYVLAYMHCIYMHICIICAKASRLQKEDSCAASELRGCIKSVLPDSKIQRWIQWLKQLFFLSFRQI